MCLFKRFFLKIASFKPQKNWLLSPWVIFGGVFSGVAIGIFDKSLAGQLLPIGTLYLRLLQMLVLPILISAVISGLGNLFVSGIKKASFRGWVVFCF